MFPILVYFLIFFAVYRLCSLLEFSKKNSVICSLSFLLIPAASVSSFLVSTDLLLLLFWILALTQLLKIREKASVVSFFLLGLFLGLAFLAKYAAVYFLLSFFVILIVDKKLLITQKNNPVGFLVFLIVFVCILSPNIYWNINNGWVTLSHTSDNANFQNMSLNLIEPLKFLISQIFMISPFLFFSFLFYFKSFRLDFKNNFLLVFSLPIIFIVLVESFLVRANANWAAPALVSLFVLFFRLVIQKKQSLVIINFAVNYFVAVFLFVSILTSSDLKIFDRIRGVDIFVEEVLKTARNNDLVVSDRIIFSSISYETRNNKNNVFMPFRQSDKITNHFQMTKPLSQNHKRDFYLIGGLSDINYLLNKNQSKLIGEFDVPFSSSRLKFYEINFK